MNQNKERRYPHRRSAGYGSRAYFFEMVSIFLTRLNARIQILFWMLMQIPAYGILEILFRLERPADYPTFVNFDVQIYFNAAKNALTGQLPYRDFFFPYPPFSLFFFIPPASLSPSPNEFSSWFKLETLILIWAGLVTVAFIARQINQPLNRTLLFYTLSVPAIGSILWQRYDLLPAILVLLAFAAWVKGWNVVAWVLLAGGTLIKIYPALLVPLFAVMEWNDHGIRRALRNAAIFSAMVVLGMLPFFIASFEETASVFFTQTGRGFEVESVGASLMMAASWFGFPAQAAYKRRLNTWEVDSPASGVLQLIFLALQIAVTAFVYLRFLRVKPTDSARLIRYSVAVIAMSLLTSKVFSAQFIVWSFPLALLSGEKRFLWTASLFWLSAALTQAVFPFLWQPLKEASPLAVGALLLRDAAMAATAVISIKEERTRANAD